MKPAFKLDTIGDLGIKPEKAGDFYTESRMQEQYFVKAPGWDSIEDNSDLLAIHNDQEHTQMLKLQEELLANAKRQSIINANRIQQLYNLQNETRARFIEANNFFKDCDDKKIFAEVKVADEKQLHIELKAAINVFKNKINVLQEFRFDLQKVVKQFEPFETVIKEFVDSPDNNFTSVKDCTDRCDALMMTQVEVVELQRKKIQEIEELRLLMIKITNEAKLTVLGLNNELSELERAYAQARSECLKFEKIISNTKDCIIECRFTQSRILDDIYCMYFLLCKRRKLNPLLSKDDVEKQLDFIKDEIQIMRSVFAECLRKIKE